MLILAKVVKGTLQPIAVVVKFEQPKEPFAVLPVVKVKKNE